MTDKENLKKELQFKLTEIKNNKMKLDILDKENKDIKENYAKSIKVNNIKKDIIGVDLRGLKRDVRDIQRKLSKI